MTRLHSTASALARQTMADTDDAAPAAVPAAAPAIPFTGPTPDHWLTAVSADFNTAADWSTGTVPGAGNSVILDAAGKTAYTVTATTSENVDDVQTGKTATLAIAGGSYFIIHNGTGSGVNAGTIADENGQLLYLRGTFKNTGSIDLDGTSNGARVQVFGGGAEAPSARAPASSGHLICLHKEPAARERCRLANPAARGKRLDLQSNWRPRASSETQQ